jgi:catechol 2,3-dioxygenase-like lactoylglutathione lyase family enzyme
VKILFVTSVAVVTPDPAASRALYIDALGLPLRRLDGEYFASEEVPGTRHFGVWPLAQAARACFGTDAWPSDRPVPQVSIEFEVEDAAAVDAAARELERGGHAVLHGARTEPWGQVVARLLSPEGAIVGISFAPQMHDG